MAKVTKKKSKEQILLEKRIRERERYAKIKNDPVQRAIQKEKERKKYEAKKKKKQVKMVSEMNNRESRAATWRKHSNKYYERKTRGTSALPVTPPDSPDSNENLGVVQTSEQRKTAGRKRVQRDRSKIVQRNRRLESVNAKLIKEKEKYRKRYERLLAQQNASTARKVNTPKTRVVKIMNKKDDKLIRRKLLFGEVVQEQLLTNYGKLKSPKEKYKYVSTILGDKKIFKKYKVLKNVKMLMPSHSCRFRNNKRQLKKNTSLNEKVRRDIQTFLEDDENTRQSPGKKDTITKKKVKKQKRYLNDTLENLHKKFLTNCNYKISYTTFCRYRPFWVIYQKVDMRDTCQCKKCANTEYIVSALHNNGIISLRTGKELISSLCCTDSHSNKTLSNVF